MHSSRCRCRCCVLVAADGRRRRRGRRGGGCWVLLVATTIVFAVVVIVVVAIPRHRDRPWRTSARTRPPRRLSPPARELQCGAGRIIIEGSSLSCVVRSSRRVARVGMYIPFNIQHFRHIPPPPQLTLIIICPSPPSLLSRIHRLSHSFCIVDFRGRTTTTHQNKSGHNGTRSHVHLRRVSRRVGSGGAVWGAGRRENERTRGRRRREAVFRDYIYIIVGVVFSPRRRFFPSRAGSFRFHPSHHTHHSTPPALFAFRSHYLPYNNARRNPPGAIYTCHVYL
jgi:hypothetical protein